MWALNSSGFIELTPDGQNFGRWTLVQVLPKQ